MGFNYCDINDVKMWLSGLDISEMPSNLDLIIEQNWIPWAKREIDNYVGENFDLTTTKEFYDGTGGKDIVLNHRPINFVRNVVLRVIPQLEWFQFKRWFHLNNIDQTGVTVAQRGGVKPLNDDNTFSPPYVYDENDLVPDDAKTSTPAEITGVFEDSTERYEESDLFVDCRKGILTIPPRILFLENQAVPFWNYTFLRSTYNIEIEYDYGYKNLESLPSEIRGACAQLVAASVLTNKGLFYGSGAGSLTFASTPKSFGTNPHASHIQSYRESAKQLLSTYKRIRV